MITKAILYVILRSSLYLLLCILLLSLADGRRQTKQAYEGFLRMEGFVFPLGHG